MAAYDLLIKLVKEYYCELGYNDLFIDKYFSNENFKELLSIRLANANVVIRNKTDRSSHQTHIAITGEAISFFYDEDKFRNMDNEIVEKIKVYVTESNLDSLVGKTANIKDSQKLDLLEGCVTIGKRTQNQVQLSKRNSENSESFNSLRLGLYENDLLVMLKFRNEEGILAIGIPQVFYLDYIPNYASKYDTNTYLRMPLEKKEVI